MPDPTLFSYSLVDDGGNPGSVDIKVAYDAATETVASLQGAAAAYGGFIDAITGAKIAKFEVRIPFLPDPGWKAAAIADDSIATTLNINMKQAGFTYLEPIEVPALRATLITLEKPVLAGAIQTFVTALISGSGAVFPNSKFSNALTALSDISKSVRKHKGARQRSRVVG